MSTLQEFGYLKLIKVRMYNCMCTVFIVRTTDAPNVAPINFKVLMVAVTSVTFQWNILSEQEANGIVREYVIICSERNTITRVSI